MKLKRLLLSIGIALVLLLGLMAGLRGVPEPVHAAGTPDQKATILETDTYTLFNYDGGVGTQGGAGVNDSTFSISENSWDGWGWADDCDGTNSSYWESWAYFDYELPVGFVPDSAAAEATICVDGPAYPDCYGDPNYGSDDATCHLMFAIDGDLQSWTDYKTENYLPKVRELDTVTVADGSCSTLEGSASGGWTSESVNEARFLIWCDHGWHFWIDSEGSLDSASINGETIVEPSPTDCVPIETLVVTGPVTGTAGQANGFKGTVSPPSDTEPIDWSWEASGEGLAVDDDSESYESLADLTWWYSGTKTVTTTACNCAGCLAVTNTIAITGLSWTPPFSTTFPTPPEFPPDCNCPDPSYFGILEVGHWINWLWCNLKCWILFFLDFLYWLWELLRWVFYTIANTFLFYLWVLTTSGAMQADMYFRTAANWVDESSEALGDLVQALVFDLRDKIHASMTKWADWVDVSFDELGNWLQESVYNVRDWSHITLVDFGEYLNDFFTNLGEGWAGSIINIRDWSYDFLTMVGDFFASWGTNLGDFLAESTYEFRDWTYESLTNLANFVRDSGDNIGNAAEDFVLKIDEWLYDTLTKFGTLLNDWATSLGDYLSAFILAIDAWLYDALTKIGETLNAWIRFIGDVLASFLLFINTVVGGTLAGIYAVVAAQAYVFALLLEVLNMIVTMMHEGLDTIIFLTDLVIGMLTGVKDALDAQTKAELFQGEAFYFWRGLEFFESAIGDTPLAALNSVAIGLMGFRLAMWTAGQVADFMEDISRY
jgi:hypothetical protein